MSKGKGCRIDVFKANGSLAISIAVISQRLELMIFITNCSRVRWVCGKEAHP